MLRRDPLIPPRRLVPHGRGEFAGTGDAHLRDLVDLAGLRPEDRVLDLACGAGVLARALAGYLAPGRGSYEGLDPDAAAVGWCRRAYRRHRHMRFLRADLFDARTHPGAGHSAADYRLPHDDSSFDVVAALGVFGHLLEAAAERQLGEAARVLRPGGRLLATVFVLDDDSRARVASGEATLDFLDPAGHVALLSEDLPEEAVAYDVGWLRDKLGASGLRLDRLEPGGWRGRDDARDLLDILVAVRA